MVCHVHACMSVCVAVCREGRLWQDILVGTGSSYPGEGEREGEEEEEEQEEGPLLKGSGGDSSLSIEETK